jgi:hypothetical protein
MTGGAQVKIVFGILLVLGLSRPSAFAAESPDSVLKNQSLVPLKRMTVGPYDNFQATVDESETYLYYTRSENLSSQIMRLDIKTGLTQAVTARDADARSPALSPDGKVLALNYFKNDAKGDICLLRGDEIDCITQKERADHSPVWLGNNRLAYISSDDSGRKSKLMVYDLEKKTAAAIFSGELYAPDLSPDGKTLVFKGKRNELVLYDLNARKVVRTLNVELPGLTGPSRFSSDGKYLYFAQYMLDSNRDLTIDGRDAAAIFRYDISASGLAAPIQMTSLDQNCSFPHPSKQFLYMTCAFEGALDIYRAPLSGTVPPAWGQGDLEEAHRVARSYSDRILFLNHIHNRLFQLSDSDYEERMMQNFVYAQEILPARFYVEALLNRAPGRSDLKAFSILFDAYSRWEVLPQKKNLGAFAEFLEARRKELAQLPRSPETVLTEAYLDQFANKPQMAEKKLLALQFEDDIGLFLSAKLARLVMQERYTKYLADHVLKVDATEQNRLYYLSLWLAELKPGVDPSAAVNALKPLLKAPMSDILQNEITLYRITQIQERAQNRDNKRAVAALVEKYKNDYFALRLLINRSITVLYQGKKSKDMADIVSLWISYIKRDSKEFPYAVDAMRQNFVDLAYQFMNTQGSDKDFAIGAFFDSIRTSDDLESHYQYVTLNSANWQEFINQYRTMISQGLISSESWTFIHVVRDIVLSAKRLEADDYAEAAGKIEALSDAHLGTGMKYLLLGYLYHKQLQQTYEGFKYDKSLAEKAHKAYLFAIDGSMHNDRIQASALQNLALLHLEIRNYTLASEFLLQRQTIAYASLEEEQAAAWLRAKALYLSNRSNEAYDALQSALTKSQRLPIAFHEKAAFYAWNSANFEAAESHFKQLPESALTDPVRLGYGYTLMKLKRGPELKAVLDPLLTSISSTTAIKEAKAPALTVQPLKLKFLALGLLAQTQSVPLDQRAWALEERIALFERIQSHAKVLHFQGENLSDQRIKELQDLAQITHAQGSLEKASKALSASLEAARAHGETFGFLSNTLISALKNAWILSRSLALPLNQELSLSLANKVDEEFFVQKAFSPLVTQKWAEMKLIQAYGLNEDFIKRSADLFKTSPMAKLKVERPDLYETIEAYRDEVHKDAKWQQTRRLPPPPVVGTGH